MSRLEAPAFDAKSQDKLRRDSWTGPANGNGESIGRIVDKKRVDVALRKADGPHSGDEDREHRVKRAERSATRLSNVIPARVVRDEHAMQKSPSRIRVTILTCAATESGPTPSKETHAPRRAAPRCCAGSFSFCAWIQIHADGCTPARSSIASCSNAATAGPVCAPIVRPVSRWAIAAARISFCSATVSGPPLKPSLIKPGRMPVASMPFLDSSIQRWARLSSESVNT